RLAGLQAARKTGLELVAARKDVLTLENSLKTSKSKYRIEQLKALAFRFRQGPDQRQELLTADRELTGLYTGPLAPEDQDLIGSFLYLQRQKCSALQSQDATALHDLELIEQTWQESLKGPGTLFPLEKVTLAEFSQLLSDLISILMPARATQAAEAETGAEVAAPAARLARPEAAAAAKPAAGPRDLHTIQALLFKARSEMRKLPAGAPAREDLVVTVSELEAEVRSLNAGQRVQAIQRCQQGIERLETRSAAIRTKIDQSTTIGALTPLRQEGAQLRDKLVKELQNLNQFYLSAAPEAGVTGLQAWLQQLVRQLAERSAAGVAMRFTDLPEQPVGETVPLRLLAEAVSNFQQQLELLSTNLDFQQSYLQEMAHLQALEALEISMEQDQNRLLELEAALETASEAESEALLRELMLLQQKMLDSLARLT
ncbi:MAG: hypothetical protein ACAI44_00625, partial [Candidatus Sericytochromatia bacterium]